MDNVIIGHLFRIVQIKTRDSYLQTELMPIFALVCRQFSERNKHCLSLLALSQYNDRLDNFLRRSNSVFVFYISIYNS